MCSCVTRRIIEIESKSGRKVPSFYQRHTLSLHSTQFSILLLLFWIIDFYFSLSTAHPAFTLSLFLMFPSFLFLAPFVSISLFSRMLCTLCARKLKRCFKRLSLAYWYWYWVVLFRMKKMKYAKKRGFLRTNNIRTHIGSHMFDLIVHMMLNTPYTH